ncbi:UDP-N-acetylglucosamine 2-epimerase [Emcibacter sp.]|uniref:UDP-N-acetylglucosamine 2-epimerase n=1 Tax=Emcibacter sp. TaxID=1979954 RepID=UPI003A8D9942
MKKRIVFITGTRADFGKIKSLINRLLEHSDHEIHIFVTGMHMLSKYGYTCDEVEKCGYNNIYKYINQNYNDTMDTVLAKTVAGFSDYVKEMKPDMIVVHGDRVEAMACSLVGCLNNILIAHIEGGEVSGTIDELIRHAVSKVSQLHFVSNEEAKKRLIQLGEREDTIYTIGSPDMDIMNSDTLPDIEKVKSYYEIPFEQYAILLFHPVTTDTARLRGQCHSFLKALVKSNHNYVVIYPNNDHGSEIILEEYEQLKGNKAFRVFPSMRFEYFLTLMKHSDFVIGNSSAGVREAPYYGVPSINVGDRQKNRASAPTILNTDFRLENILDSIEQAPKIHRETMQDFGKGGSDVKFCDILNTEAVWETSNQKYFIDIL